MFFLSKFLFLHFWRIILPDRLFLIGKFFFQFVEYITTLPSALQGICRVLWVFPCTWQQYAFILTAFKIFVFDFWQFDYVIMYLTVDCFGLFLLGAYKISCILMSISFPRFGRFLVIISLNMLSAPSGTPKCIYWSTSWFPASALGFLYSFSFFPPLLLLWLDNFKWSILEFTESVFYLIKSCVEPFSWIF